MRIILAMAMTFALAGAVHADDLVITSMGGNGQVTWNYPTNGVAQYRVEWAAALPSNEWTDLRCGIQGITPTGSTMAAEVPIFYRIKAIGPNPYRMVYIPSGRFDMGDTFAEGSSDERPVHSVYVSGFWMDRFEVSSQLWNEVHSWALTNGYSFSNVGSARTNDHPVHTVNWHDAVKWCNARSEREDLTPCYYIDPIFFNAYRTGETDIENAWVNWEANGYRLPTEAEWEKAARGGSAGNRFPWGSDTINHYRANYHASTGYSYDLSSGYHPDFATGGSPYTSPIITFTANAYGLFDCEGNVREWCWDWYNGGYYASSPAKDPRGPDGPLSSRVLRGGSWNDNADSTRVANRNVNNPVNKGNHLGFRCARGL